MSRTTTFADLLAGTADAELRPLAEWAAILPGPRRPDLRLLAEGASGRGMSPRVRLLRWHVHGVRGHRLPTLRIGHRHVVRGADLREYLAAIASGALPEGER